MTPTPIRRALISVSDKTGLVRARALYDEARVVARTLDLLGA